VVDNAGAIAMRLLAVILGTLVTVFGAGSAWADGSLKDAPAPVARTCAGGPFSGAYVGGSVGYLKHEGSFHNKDVGEGFGWTVDDDDSGVLYGIYSGYNIQCDRFVFGLESDFNGGNTESVWTESCCGIEFKSELDWLSTSRARLGVVYGDSTLFYVTGGLAYGKVEHSLAIAPPAFTVDFSDSDTDKRWGWTLGGGVEFLRQGKWSLKAEALYVDLGEETHNYDASLACGIECTARYGWEDEFWTARVGLSYHFGAREEEAVPLK